MPALPWSRVSPAEPGAELTVMGSRLPLRSYRHIPGFMKWTLRIRSQLEHAEGLVGYSLDAHLLKKTFWTVSAWTSQAALDEFVRQNPHGAGMVAIRPHMQKSGFVFWTATPEDLPVDWDDVRRRISEKAERKHDGSGRSNPTPSPE
ncbi:MAG: DUF3291 domain-containing protein [Actinomycetota bacterium]|nr:DUF3291 domain-containing protein [Actinomycetota bacterium]